MPSSPPNKPFPLAKIDKANDDDSIESRGDNNGQRSSTPSTLNGADTNPQRSPDYAKAQGPSGPKGPNNSNNGNNLENKERQGDSTNEGKNEEKKSGKDAMEAGKGQENEVEEKAKVGQKEQNSEASSNEEDDNKRRKKNLRGLAIKRMKKKPTRRKPRQCIHRIMAQL